MNIKKIVFTLLVLLAQHTYGQVTIGNGKPSVKGALLQLKETETVNGANSTKGLLLPRVQLTAKDHLADLGITDNTYPKPEYNGMVVYNIADIYSVCFNLWDGVYMWVESEWVRLNPDHPISEFIDDVNIYHDLRNPSNPEEYPYRQFGNAGIWMLENMRALVTPSGIPLNSNVNAENGGWLYSIPSYVVPQAIGPVPAQPEVNPNLVSTWTKEQGILYNWAAATVNASGTEGAGGADGKGTDVNQEGYDEGPRIQGICPSGWHIPSEKEWTLLENEIIRNTSKYTYTEKDISKTDTILITTSISPTSKQHNSHGNAMREYCSYTPYNKGTSKRALHGGFAALPTGYYTTYGGWVSSGIYMTTSSQSRKASRWYIQMNGRNSVVYHNPTLGANNTQMFFSVRCKKD